MTIAACHVSPEGVVLGADSTSTVSSSTHQHFHNYEQKLFEVGPPGSSVALATWGMGRIGAASHRTIAAKLGQAYMSGQFATLQEMANHLAGDITNRLKLALPTWDQACALLQKFLANPTDPKVLTKDEWDLVVWASNNWVGGYFLAGRLDDAADCEGFQVEWSITNNGAAVEKLDTERPYFKGQPQIMQRLILGYDQDLASRIMQSGKWTGTQDELLAVMTPSNLRVRPDLLPLRDAIDWVHTVIHTTIRAMKFSGQHYCGGPVEIAVVTTDRPFRWVCHKDLNAAIITAQEGVKR